MKQKASILQVLWELYLSCFTFQQWQVRLGMLKRSRSCVSFSQKLYVQYALGTVLRVKAEESSVCRSLPHPWNLCAYLAAWASGRTDHQVLASTGLCRNLLNQARLQICPTWTEKVINTLLKIRKELGREARDLSPKGEPNRQQSLEHGKRQRDGQASELRWSTLSSHPPGVTG